jgi:transmembrane sensor
MTEQHRNPLENPLADTSFATKGTNMRPLPPFSAFGDMPDMTPADCATRRRDQALDWFLRLQAAPGDAQLRAGMEQWCAADEANAKAYRKAERVWQMSAQLAPTTQAQWPQEPVLAPVVSLPVRPKRRRYWLGGAIAACLMLALAPSLSQRMQADYRTAAGETRDVTLADGSVVQLDSDTAISVRFAGDRRDVQLLGGQAFFKVAPDKSKPFHVRAEALEVTVTGTAFNVDIGAGQMRVAVQEGSVKVDDWRVAKALAGQLKPGDRLDYHDGVAHLDRFAPAQAAAWRNGQVIADDTPVSEVVAELRRYAPGLVVLRNDELGRKRVTGVYDLRKPLAALRAVMQPHGGKVETYGPWVIVLR